MKLSSISENMMAHQLGQALKSTNYFNRPAVQVDQPFEASSGHDAGARSTDATISQPSGVPPKQRQQKLLGMASRPGTIRL